MGKVTALKMDVITEKSGHSVVPNAVSVCITPAAPSPLPIPYPVVGSSIEGITDAAMRTRVEGSPWATVGSVIKTCHGNEPGTLKEVVSLNTAGPCFITLGAPIVLVELGLAGITGSLCQSNKAITVGTNGAASGAGGASGGSGAGAGAGAGGSGPGGPSGPSNGGGGGGGSNSGAAGSSSSADSRASGQAAAPGTSSGPAEQHTCQGGHPVDLVTGAVVDQAVDFELPGCIPLDFKRSYSSLRYRDRAASLGPGWAQPFEQSLALEPEAIVHREESGRNVYFARVAVGESSFHRRERLTLRRDGEFDFTLYDHAKRLSKSFKPLQPGGLAMLQSIADGYGNRIEFDYEAGRLQRVRDTAARQVLLHWRGSRITRLEVQSGGAPELWVDYEYDDAGRLTSVVDALGHDEQYEYDGYGRMSAATTKAGVRFGYDYDADSGRCIRTAGPNGLYALELEYDSSNRRTLVYGEEPRVIEWAELPGYARRTLLHDGRVLDESAWDPDGYRVATANGAGEGVQTWYDARGNELKRVEPDGQTTSWEYDAEDNPIRRVDADGSQTTFTHDRAGGLIGIRHGYGKFFTLSRDERGRLLEVADEGGSLRKYEYDTQHNLIAETDAKGGRTRFAFDALGRVISQTDALGRQSVVSRDRLGRPLLVRRPDGTSLKRSYDGAGNLVRQVAEDGSTTECHWTGMNKLARVIDPGGRSWRLEYTAQERLAKVTNPAGQSYSYRYDEAGRVVESTTFDARTQRFFVGPSGRIERIQQPGGVQFDYSFDRAGRLLEETASDGTATRFRRDAQGRIVEATLNEPSGKHTTLFERDERGRIVVERQGDRTLRFAYDLDNRLLERTLFDGTTTRYAYDREGALVRVEHAGRSLALEHDAGGRLSSLRDEKGVFSQRQRHDALDRLLEQRVEGVELSAGTPNVLVDRLYAYDAAGRVARIDDTRWGRSSYGYDDNGRLTSASVGAHREVFTYDPAGALIGALEGLGAESRPAKWKTAPGNQLTETATTRYRYDARGRRVAAEDKRSGALTHYRWDERDRLRAVELPDGARVVMAYDAFGRRVRKELIRAGKSAVTEFLHHGDLLCADFDLERGGRSFVHHPADDTLLLHCERKEVFVVVNDHLGVPKELIDREGRVAWAARHDAWGRILDQRWDATGEKNRNWRVSSPFRLLGQYADEDTGLTFTRFRAFDPAVGRFCSPDPLGIVGGMDLHGFDGAPTVDVDPLGLSATGAPHGNAAQNLPPLRGKSVPQVQKTLADNGFTRSNNPTNPHNLHYRHPDGSEVRVHQHGNQNITPYKSGNNAHLHKEDPSGNQLTDRGVVSTNANETHIGIKNPRTLPAARGRNHGD